MAGDFKHDLPPETHLAAVSALKSARRHRLGWLTLAGLAIAGTAFAAEPEKPRLPPEFRHLPPLKAMREAAHAGGLSLSGLAPTGSRSAMRPGDSVTVLVSLTEGNDLKQWLFRFTMEEPTAKEQARPHDTARMFTPTGYEFHFDGGRAGIRMAVIGPLEESDAGKKAATAPNVRRQRILVDADYLGLGMERMPAMMIRLKAFRAAHPDAPAGNIGAADKPFPPEVVAANRKATDFAGISEADERSFIGSFLALREFVTLAARTPGLQEVFKSVLDIPWWSLITSGGKMNLDLNMMPFERELATAPWLLSEGEKVYALPFLLKLNTKPALLFQLALTSPKPPLTVCAGIIGLAAGSPDGKGPVLTLQVVASQAATESESELGQKVTKETKE